MNAAVLEKLASDIDRYIAPLKNAGWDMTGATNLTAVLRQVIAESNAMNWPEASGRAKALLAIFSDFADESPLSERLSPVLQSVCHLVSILRKGPLSGQIEIDNLPAQPRAWVFCVLGKMSADLSELCQSLQRLGFMVKHLPSCDFGDQRLYEEQLVVFIDVGWLVEYGQAFKKRLPPVNEKEGGKTPIGVGLLDGNVEYGKVLSTKQDFHLLLDVSVGVSGLLSELAGFAWMPKTVYKVLLISADPRKQNWVLGVLQGAGFAVEVQSQPLQTIDSVIAFIPDVMLLDGSLDFCLNRNFLALCRQSAKYGQLSVVYWRDADDRRDVPRQGLALETNCLNEPFEADELLALMKAKARKHRLVKDYIKRWRVVLGQQHRLRGALDAHSIVSVASVDGAIIDVNQKFCDISGYSREELIGRNHRLVKSGHHPQEFFVEMWQTISTGKIWQGEIQNRSKDGKPYWVQSTIAPILDRQGRPRQYFSIRTDVTRQKQIQAEGRKQQRLMNLLREGLQRFNETRDLGLVLSHLLDGLLLLTESAFGFIAELQSLPDGSSYLEIKAITDVGRDSGGTNREQGMQASEMKFKNLDSLYGAVVHSGKPIITNNPRNHPLGLGIPEGHPGLTSFMGVPIGSEKNRLGVMGLANRQGGYDSGLLEFLAPFAETCANLIETARANQCQQQAINNLAQFLEKSEILQTKRGEHIQAVSFELRNELNSLLGQAQLLLMQANLDADIRECALEIVNAGDRFNNLLGSLGNQANEIDFFKTEDLAPSVMTTDKDQDKPAHRVLVVEDNSANRAVLKMQLKVLGIGADLVASGTEALSQWKQGNYDLMLSDVNMPGMDGLQLTRSIRAAESGANKHLPIIAITASTYPEELAACLQAGMDDTLCKPIDLDNLREKLQQWLPQQTMAGPASPPVIEPPKKLKDFNSQQVLDVDSLRATTGGFDFQQIRGLVDLFTSTAQAELVLCHQQLLAQDTASLALSMHKLKSSAQAVGALRFAELAIKLEAVAKEGHLVSAAALLLELEHALTDVEEAIANPSQPFVQQDRTISGLPKCVLVVDDDAVVRRQTSLLLKTLGVINVLVAGGGRDALQIMEKQGPYIDLLLCDLNMPEMDGIEFLRSMGEIAYQGGVILVSGVDDRLLQSAVELAGLQGLHLLGSLGKPLSGKALLTLLNEPSAKQVGLVKTISGLAITAEDVLDGLANNEFDVYFQPKVDAFTLKPVGVEALARWRRKGEVIPADTFILAAEHHNLIGQLSEALLVKAFIGGNRLADMGFPLIISVNLSATWMSNVSLPDFIQACIQATGLKVDNVILEITETGVMGDLTKALDILTRLRLKGFKLSIDDFGIGYSSLEQLQRIPFSELKLDRTFVKGAGDNVTARTILSTCVEMAAKLNLQTVAEGVETQEDLDLVRGVGCNLVQGWFIAKAMPLDELISWLQSGSSPKQ